MSDKIYQAASNMDNLFQANLMYLDDRDVAQPLLALRAPSQADGSWQVFPDGTMRTTQPQVTCNPRTITWHSEPNYLTCRRVSDSVALCRDT